MKRVVFAGALIITLWVAGSAIFQWPPLWHYAGDSLNACLNNLRQIDALKEEWALETNQTNGTPVDAAQLEQYFRTNGSGMREFPRCPSGGTYTIGNLGQDPVCSIGTNIPPAPVKERVGLLGWRWKIPPSSPGSHALPPR